MKENKAQFHLFNPDKYKVKPIPGRPEKPKESLDDFTASILRTANSRHGDTHTRNDFHDSMEKPKPKKPHRTRFEKLVLLRARYARHLAVLENAGTLDEVLQTEYTAETIPQIVAKVKEARRSGAKLDPKIEEELQANESRVRYWLALRKHN